jgi:hypothetical protein
MAALSPLGAKEAFNYIAMTPEFSATATPITRAKTFGDPATGEVTTYLATASGAPIAGDVDIVQAAFDEWAEPWGTDSTAAAAAEVVIDGTYEVWVKSGLTEAQILAAIDTALAVFLEEVDIGGTVISPATGMIYKDSLSVVVATATLDGLPEGQTLGVKRAIFILANVDEDTDADGVDDAIGMAQSEVAVLGTITGTVNFL